MAWRKEFSLHPEIKAFVWVGRMVQEKGLDLVINAFAARRHDPSWRVYMVGDGPLKSQCEIHVQRLGLEKRVVFLGMRHDVREILSAFDVFLLPSLSEGLPIALLEAAAAGLPLLVSDVGGMPDVVSENNGWLVRVGDVNSLTDYLEVACGRSAGQLREMGARSASIARAKFSVSVCARRYEDVYGRVVGKIRQGA